MPTNYRAQCCWQVASMLPRDVHCINPCFRRNIDPGLTPGGAQSLCDDLATALNTWAVSGTSHQLTVKLYEIQDPVPGEPHRPKATKTLNAGIKGTINRPAEVALCLSFYGGENARHQRGRLYLPSWALNASSPNDRPSSAEQTKAGDLVSIFSGLGGADVDWVVWSPTRRDATKVDHWYVDDEWDTQRRRGQKATQRLSGTTSG